MIRLSLILSVMIWGLAARGANEVAATVAADPAAAPAEFKALVQAVLNQAASIESQQATLDYAREYQKSRSLYWTPTGSAAITNQVSGLIPITGNTVTNGTLVALNFNILKFGANELSRQAAVARTGAEKSRLEQAREDLETSISNLIFQLIQQRQIIEIRKGHVDIQDQSLNVAKERYRQGQLPEQEYEKSKVDLESSRVLLVEAQLAEVQTLNAIKTLASIEPKLSSWPLAKPLPGPVASAPRRKAEEFYTSKSFKLDADYFHKNAQSTWRSAYLPSLDLSGGWDAASSNPTAQGQLYAGVTLTIPLWDQWFGVAQAQESESSSRSSSANFQQAIRQAQAGLDTLDQRIQLSRQNVESSKQSVDKLQGLRNDSLRRFRLGRSTVNDLLIDENRYLDAQNSLLNSMMAYHQLVVEACHDRNETILNCF